MMLFSMKLKRGARIWRGILPRVIRNYRSVISTFPFNAPSTASFSSAFVKIGGLKFMDD